jgi:hypothetical protein
MVNLDAFPGRLKRSYRAHNELILPPQDLDYVGLETR